MSIIGYEQTYQKLKRLLHHGMMVPDLGATPCVEFVPGVLKLKDRALIKTRQGLVSKPRWRRARSAGTCLLASGLRMV